VDNPVVEQVVVSSISIEVDSEDEYQVSSIEDSRVYCNRLQYTILWTGYHLFFEWFWTVTLGLGQGTN
jgi:hypothetical protein